jgi:site-specific recombinase XerD
MRAWEQLVEQYVAEYRARGCCEGSVARVQSVLGHWGQWLRRRRPRPQLQDIDAGVLVAYLHSRTCFHSKVTVYGILSVMRGMGDYLVREGVWISNPLRWMKGPTIRPYHHLPKRIASEDMQAMWRAAAGAHGRYSQHLWLTVLAVLYGTGLRRGELERLDLDCWDRETGNLRVDGRKTGQERCVPVPELAGRCLEAYLPQRHNQLERVGRIHERALLISRRGDRLSGSSISNGVHALAERAGIAFHSVHQFRHSCASDLLEAGVALPDVQRILGHRVLQTTLRYTHIADPQRRAAIASHPINQWLIWEAA